MRILVTNDDGINAPGLKIAQAIAAEVAGPDGEVWTVAPAVEKSGVGHCISYINPALMVERGPRSFALEGFPADCVLGGIYDVFDGALPDLILSGVNRGNNSAENTLYSGTIGAAIEASLQGIKAIALSQYYGPLNRDLENPFEAAAETGAQLIKDLLAKGHWGGGDYNTFYNVNFPPVAAKDVKGIKVVAQGYRRDTFFSVEPHHAPSGRKFLWIKGGAQDVPTDAGTDAHANLAGYTSVTPMRCDLTAHDLLADLRESLE